MGSRRIQGHYYVPIEECRSFLGTSQSTFFTFLSLTGEGESSASGIVCTPFECPLESTISLPSMFTDVLLALLITPSPFIGLVLDRSTLGDGERVGARLAIGKDVCKRG